MDGCRCGEPLGDVRLERVAGADVLLDRPNAVRVRRRRAVALEGGVRRVAAVDRDVRVAVLDALGEIERAISAAIERPGGSVSPDGSVNPDGVVGLSAVTDPR